MRNSLQRHVSFLLLLSGLMLHGMSAASNAQPVLHAIIAADTIRRPEKQQDVAADMKFNVSEVLRWLKSNAPDDMVKTHVLVDTKWAKQEVFNKIASIPMRDGDSIMFYYCGHGFYGLETPEHSGFERTLFRPPTDNSQDLWLSDIHDQLLTLNPRFFISIVDCCSVQPGQRISYGAPAARPVAEPTPLFRSLFHEPKGVITINSSAPEEQAVGGVYGKGTGSLFTNALFKRLSPSDQPSDWGTIIQETRKDVDDGFSKLIEKYDSQVDDGTDKLLLGDEEVRAQRTQTVWSSRNGKKWIDWTRE